MARIDDAQAKYRAKAGVMGENYASGMSAFMGRDVSATLPVRTYKSKITPATADKWRRNLDAAFR
jgi:hypothetical protein